MSDTPPIIPEFPPVPFIERLKAFVGDTHRPFFVLLIGIATAYAIVAISWGIAVRNPDPAGGAIWIAAVGAIATAIYGAKSLENHGKEKSAAQVEIAKANATAEVAKAAAAPVQP